MSFRADILEAVEQGRVRHVYAESGVPGCCQVVATLPWCPSPVGLLWYRHTRVGEIEVLNIFTCESCRRCGVMRFLQRSLIEDYPDLRSLVTQSGTELGAAWMTAMGWQKLRTGEWRLRIKRKAARK